MAHSSPTVKGFCPEFEGDRVRGRMVRAPIPGVPRHGCPRIYPEDAEEAEEAEDQMNSASSASSASSEFHAAWPAARTVPPSSNGHARPLGLPQRYRPVEPAYHQEVRRWLA